MDRMQAWFAAATAIGTSMSALAQSAQQWTITTGGNGHWYAIVTDPGVMNWHAARAAAEARGGSLACIETAEEWAFVRALADASDGWNGPHGPWLGGYQDITAGASVEPALGWRWVSGEPIGFSAWHSNQPSNDCAGTPEDFMHLYRYADPDTRWNDIGLPGTCQTLPVIAAVFEWSADCDGNGLVDFGEIASGGVADINQNGTPDACETRVVRTWGIGDLVPAEGTVADSLFVDLGENFAICLHPDGGITGWGANEFGQWNVPAAIGTLRTVACGYAHTIGIRTDGALVAWGDNQSGQCNVPPGIGTAVSIAAGAGASFAANSNGQVFGWGSHPPVPLGLRPVTKVAAGWGIGLARDYLGHLTVWGQNNHGQQNVPANVGRIADMDGSYGHIAALREDGTVVCWGMNSYGQCNVPVGLPTVVDVDAGSFHTVALLADGSVRAWGAGSPGFGGWPNFNQSAIPDDLGDASSVRAGGYFTVALTKPLVPCIADIDANGVVNGVDLAILLDKWGTSGGKDYPAADIDRSGVVDGADLSQVLNAWGLCP
jgi:hypothetical protein